MNAGFTRAQPPQILPVDEYAKVMETKPSDDAIILDICKDWTLEKHIEVITSALKDYVKIRDDYLDQLKSFRERITTKHGEFNVDALCEYEVVRDNFDPELDIELQYFIPGITESMAFAIYNHFWKNNWKGWYTTITDGMEEGFSALTFKIRSIFDYDTYKAVGLIGYGNEDKPVKIVPVECKYLDAEFGKPGERILLIRTLKSPNVDQTSNF